MTTTSRRRARRGAPPSSSSPKDPVKATSTSIATAIILFVILGFALIPVTWALVHGYRWALS